MAQTGLRGINDLRRARGAADLVAHGSLQREAERLVKRWAGVARSGEQPPEADLKALRNQVPEAIGLAWQAWSTSNSEQLIQEAATASLTDPTMTDLGIGAEQAAGTTQWLVYVLLAQRLPELTPFALDQGERRFHTTCALCGESQYLQVTLGVGDEAGSLGAVCQKCGRTYDSFAPDTAGHYRRLDTFPQDFNPQPLKSATAIWLRQLRRMSYETDLKRYGRMEVWQQSPETWRDRLGDCEDGSLLLSDWLRANGHDVKVAIGECEGEGHAWVVLHADGHDYLLESTGGASTHLRVPPRAEARPEYFPETQFDASGVWYRTGQGWTADYRDPDAWAAGPS